MVVPFSEIAEKSCRKKEKFNKKLRRGRVQVIECGFGIWKWEYPVLLNGITAKSPESAGKLIMVLIFCVEFLELLHLTLDLSSVCRFKSQPYLAPSSGISIVWSVRQLSALQTMEMPLDSAKYG